MIKLLLVSVFVIVNLGAYSLKSALVKLETLKHLKDVKFKEINVDYDPFYNPLANKSDSKENSVPSVNFVKRKTTFRISAIFNSEAFINGKWYRENDKINGYKILHIYPHRIILKKGLKLLHLSIGNKVNILKITEKIK